MRKGKDPSGSVLVLVTNGYGRPKNIKIRMGIRIPNTAINYIRQIDLLSRLEGKTSGF
jgi:hypothetical protein